ncbi:GH-E family nuclease [Actinopolymorpha pittospori]|nr:GH-E family nuclease [Actinopolymorpha pittospori]
MRRLALWTGLGLFFLLFMPGTAAAACNLKYDNNGNVPGQQAGECAGAIPAAGSAVLGVGSILAAAGAAAATYGRGNMKSINQALAGIYRGSRVAASNYPPTRNRVSLPKGVRHQIYLRQPRAANGEDFICAVTGQTIPCQRYADGPFKGKAMRWDAATGRKLDPSDPNFSGGLTHPDERAITFGHKPGHEWRHAQIHGWRHRLNRPQVKGLQRDPDIYQVEVRSLAHGHEWDPSYINYWRPT